ncbi:MAG: hypothetical protein ABSH15_04465 [Verrucomicrobiota bacterium]|jgi:predicted DNA-binding transcriptional regulator YafY
MKSATRNPIARMRFIRGKLLRGEPFNASSVAAELEVTAKTIQRDIDFMRDQLGYEISFDCSANSFTGSPGVITTL